MEKKPERQLFCSVGHEMETRSVTSGMEARCPCDEQFVHISILLQNKKAFWKMPQEVAANLAASNTQSVW